ncbi:unnamed protein product [Caenorhabditis auriculariae]|uniref:F-box/LRR-repeat protein 15-like leucin rich repeat domain-containing protein n=1 Tax=Caenorhabditis auriculariae TaxID=2777116 RepID=A0A8S1HHP3_9PELO|nr:unnamed protein product [Caenorhabditis auriculariae]
MVKSLVNLCLAAICQHELNDDLVMMPVECKQRLLEFFSSHDQLSASDCSSLVSSPTFGCNIPLLTFYLSTELTDEILCALTAKNKRVEKITLVDCPNVSDKGARAMTSGQRELSQLELRAMNQLSDAALDEVFSPCLVSVDLSGCGRITSHGIRRLVSRNPSIRCLYLNHCRSLDDQALYDIAHFVGSRLHILEVDFPTSLSDPAAALQHLSSQCPNLSQLSLARFFHDNLEDGPTETPQYIIDGINLREVDLYGNYFSHLPQLPQTVHSIRLSVSGDEDAQQLVASLLDQPCLSSINLLVTVREANITAVDNANALICAIVPLLGTKITKLQISVPRLFDEALTFVTEGLPNMTHLALEVNHLNTNILQKYFAGGTKSSASNLRSLKICRMRMTYRVLFAIARGARNLSDLETSHMYSVDDRFLCLLGGNCRSLKSINLNGCRYISDKGLAVLARRCPLQEVRIRGTSCTDKSIYILAQFCPDLEWISYADYSGRPKFSDAALQCLRDSCIQRDVYNIQARSSVRRGAATSNSANLSRKGATVAPAVRRIFTTSRCCSTTRVHSSFFCVLLPQIRITAQRPKPLFNATNTCGTLQEPNGNGPLLTDGPYPRGNARGHRNPLICRLSASADLPPPERTSAVFYL